MRILLGHTHSGDVYGEEWVESWVSRLRISGFHVEAYPLAVSPQKTVVYFDELDILWRYKDPNLLTLYSRIRTKLENFDVFVCFNGTNIHPEFAASLDVITVYGCFDDPESSSKLSRPAAHAFDIAMVGNIAEVKTYKGWGIENVHWWPLGFREGDYSAELTKRDILHGNRANDVVLLCERVEKYRRLRVDKFAFAFPNGRYYGRGWPNGFLPEEKRVPLLQQSKIGINIHNSTGPINFRTFYLPANGVMQICDNKSHLSKIFKLDDEVIGFDSIDEAIEKAAYYLAHEDERRTIAAKGWSRAVRYYNEVECFARMVKAVEKFQAGPSTKKIMPIPAFQSISKNSFGNQILKNAALMRSRLANGISNRRNIRVLPKGDAKY
jgi:spore maturation protein CgeB